MYRSLSSPAVARLLAAVKAGENLKQSARVSGIAPSSVYRLLRDRYLQLRRGGMCSEDAVAEMGVRSSRPYNSDSGETIPPIIELINDVYGLVQRLGYGVFVLDTPVAGTDLRSATDHHPCGRLHGYLPSEAAARSQRLRRPIQLGAAERCRDVRHRLDPSRSAAEAASA
jgi:hypothetical protein